MTRQNFDQWGATLAKPVFTQDNEEWHVSAERQLLNLLPLHNKYAAEPLSKGALT